MTEKPRFNMEISLGNVLTAIGMLAVAGGTYYALQSKVLVLEERIGGIERRISSNETDTYRRLDSIEDKLDRILFSFMGDIQ